MNFLPFPLSENDFVLPVFFFVFVFVLAEYRILGWFHLFQHLNTEPLMASIVSGVKSTFPCK